MLSTMLAIDAGSAGSLEGVLDGGCVGVGP
jgi:hypothetical protein